MFLKLKLHAGACINHHTWALLDSHFCLALESLISSKVRVPSVESLMVMRVSSIQSWMWMISTGFGHGYGPHDTLSCPMILQSGRSGGSYNQETASSRWVPSLPQLSVIYSSSPKLQVEDKDGAQRHLKDGHAVGQSSASQDHYDDPQTLSQTTHLFVFFPARAVPLHTSANSQQSYLNLTS